MIRAAITLTAGFVIASVADSAPVRAVRRWYCGFKLRFLLDELIDVEDDIIASRQLALDAGHRGDNREADNRWLDAEALTRFHTQLASERDQLFAQLARLR
jgi:hypothetical protein